MKSDPRDRILEGPLAFEVARFGAPIAVGMGLQTLFNWVDAYLIGHLEPGVAHSALGAIGICDQLAALGTIISYGLTVATTALGSTPSALKFATKRTALTVLPPSLAMRTS